MITTEKDLFSQEGKKKKKITKEIKTVRAISPGSVQLLELFLNDLRKIHDEKRRALSSAPPYSGKITNQYPFYSFAGFFSNRTL